jgi:hypothetical protein
MTWYPEQPQFPGHCSACLCRVEIIKGIVGGAVETKLYQAYYITVGSTGIVCEEEILYIEALYRLQGIEYFDCQE